MRLFSFYLLHFKIFIWPFMFDLFLILTLSYIFVSNPITSSDRLDSVFTFSAFFFLFFSAVVDFGRQFYALFTHYAYTVHVLKNIKNRSHDTIYTFKYYFATVFSVFSFQFSATISSIQTDPKYMLLGWTVNSKWYN